jgi:hypothetical protein
MNNAEAEMMWEGEYIEYAKTTKAGFLSEAEMKAKREQEEQEQQDDESQPDDE